MSPCLGGPERALLRDLALRTVAATARGEAPPDPAGAAREHGLDLDGVLAERRGVFVTLTRDGALRGCVGTIEGRRPLAEAVIGAARSAAAADPRFPPVGSAEAALLDLEVSVLTTLLPVPGPEAIEVGRHGVLLRRGARQAVFLPQVAPEQGWDRETMLTHLALKAGLPPDAWRKGARFEVFTADVF